MTTKKMTLNIPEHLQEEMKIHDILHTSSLDGPSVLTMIHDQSAAAQGYVVRLYMLTQEKDELNIDTELEAFSFPSHKAAISFAIQMPKLTALELLMLQNGYNYKSAKRKSHTLH